MINALLMAAKKIGKVLHYSDDLRINKITQDTRQIEANDIYVAIVGNTFDGHDFIQDAIDKGASMIVTEKELDSDICQIVVQHTIQFIQLAASIYRDESRATFIGITGTNGKTTTKEMLYFAMSHYERVYRSPGNYNNHIGLPLSILNMPMISRFGIFEIGTNQPGEIAFLSKILQPDISLITNVGFGHMEFFDSLTAVYYEKSDIFKYTKDLGIIFKNMNDENIKDYQDSHRQVTYGINLKDAEYHIELEDNIARYKGFPIKLAVNNEHYYNNALAVIAITSYLGYYDKAVIELLANFKAVSGRMDKSEFSNFTCINDAYNANPNSMRAALQSISLEYKDEHVIAILGDMLELGKHANKAHKEILKEFENSSINTIYTFGKNFKKCKHIRAKHFEDKNEIVKALNKIKKKTTILLKGSRGMALEDILNGLKALRGEDAG